MLVRFSNRSLSRPKKMSLIILPCPHESVPVTNLSNAAFCSNNNTDYLLVNRAHETKIIFDILAAGIILLRNLHVSGNPFFWETLDILTKVRKNLNFQRVELPNNFRCTGFRRWSNPYLLVLLNLYLLILWRSWWMIIGGRWLPNRNIDIIECYKRLEGTLEAEILRA